METAKRRRSDCEEHRLLGTGFLSTIVFYGQETTVHCLSRIAATDTRVYTKLFWTVIFLAATGALGWQLSKNISSYIERAVDVKVSVQTARKLTFPSVTICSMNPFKKSYLMATDSQYISLLYLDAEMSASVDNGDSQGNDNSGTDDGSAEVTTISPPPDVANDDDYSDYQDPFFSPENANGSDFFKDSKSGDLSDFFGVFRPTLTEIARFGYKYDDLFLTCSYNQQRCSESDFVVLPNQKYGNCFTFNHNVNRTVRRTSKVGSQYGLRLVLFANQDEYVGLLGQDVGVRVSIHPYDIQPFPEQLGLNAPAGMATSIGVKMRQIQRHALSDCYDDLADTSRNSSSRFRYSYLSCERDCLRQQILKQCSCYDQLELDPSLQKAYCSSSNRTQWNCKQAVQAKYGSDDSTLDCDCQNPCLESVYETKSSISRWPSDPFGKIYNAYLTEAMNKSINASDFGTEIMMVHVFFEELNYEQINESEAYPPDKLMSDIGGTMGLWIGCSICSIFELVEMCGTLFTICIFKNRRAAMKRPPATNEAKLPNELKHRVPMSEWQLHHYMNNNRLGDDLNARNHYYGK